MFIRFAFGQINFLTAYPAHNGFGNHGLSVSKIDTYYLPQKVFSVKRLVQTANGALGGVLGVAEISRYLPALSVL